MRLPAAANHIPVGLVAVHRNGHPPAAGSDARVEAAVVERGEEHLKRLDVFQRARLADVAPVQQDVNADGLDAVGLGADEHRLEVVDVRMNVAVREQADEVQRARAAGAAARDGLPRLGREHFTALDGGRDQLGALREDLAGAERVMPDLAVAHVVVRRQADRGAVCLEREGLVVGHQPVQRRRARNPHGVARLSLAQPHAVHYNRYNRALFALENSVLHAL